MARAAVCFPTHRTRKEFLHGRDVYKRQVVSLSSGMLGEPFCSHLIGLGAKRLREFGLEPIFMPNSQKGLQTLSLHPELRAEDLKAAFLDPSIHGVLCAIGGDDTYRLLPFLMEDAQFLEAVRRTPKLLSLIHISLRNRKHLPFAKQMLHKKRRLYLPCLLYTSRCV